MTQLSRYALNAQNSIYDDHIPFEEKVECFTNPKMIVFDKDGTLGDCTSSLRNWTKHMTQNLISELQKFKSLENVQADVNSFHLALGWDADRDDVVPSAPLAAGTWEEQVETASTLFQEFGMENGSDKARQWHGDMGNLHGNDPPVIDDLRGMILSCRKAGLLVAICTSDDRSATDVALSNWGLTDLIDFSICGDEVTHSKPSAQPLQLLCKEAQLEPSNCIVVGDTTSDTGMAKNAKAGLCIGVLTGSGTTDQLLKTGADIILNDVGGIPQLLNDYEIKKG